MLLNKLFLLKKHPQVTKSFWKLFCQGLVIPGPREELSIGDTNFAVIVIAEGCADLPQQPLSFFSYSCIFAKISITLAELASDSFQKTCFDKFL